jgi:hypothetical protein
MRGISKIEETKFELQSFEEQMEGESRSKCRLLFRISKRIMRPKLKSTTQKEHQTNQEA